MRISIFIILFLSISILSLAQSDTTFFDNDWKACSRNVAKFYRIVKQQSDKFLVKDFFINNQVQMIAECSSVEPFVRNGRCINYSEMGIKEFDGYFTNEVPSGVWVAYNNNGGDSTVTEYQPDGNIFYLNKGHYDLIKNKKQFVLVEGKGQPTVVFVSGKGRSEYDYLNVYNEIKKSTQIFAYDRAGLGQSEFIDNQRTVDTMAAELHELLVIERIHPPFILVGHSMGGFVVRCFASMYPKEVVGLILIDPAHEEDFIKMKLIRSDSDKVKLCREYQGYLNRPERTIGQNAESSYFIDTTGYGMDSKIMKKISFPKNIPITVFSSMKPFTTPPYDKKDVELRYQNIEDWKKQAPRLKHLSTDKSGHFIQLEEPNLIIDEIKIMLKQIKSNYH